MPGDQNITPSRLRVDYSTARNYIQQDNYKPKSHFFSKMFSFLGPIGAAVTAVALPGIGLPIAAGLFGLSSASRDHLVRSQQKEAILAQQSQQGKGSQQIQMPGLFETTPMSAGDAATDFIAPKSMESDISQVLVNREMSINNATRSE